MEIKICAFLAEHNLPISLSDDLVQFLQSLFPRDDVIKTVTLGKQKASNVIRQVLGFNYLHQAASTLRSEKFSFIIDEATDLSTSKQLAILATYFDMDAFETKHYLVDMVEVEAGTAEAIYSSVKNTFTELLIPMENIIGYSSDTTNVMFGERNSVSRLLKLEQKNVQTVKCSCHLIHLASSYAAKTLPRNLEELCRDIYAHFHRSSKRQDVYKQFQSFFDVEPHKLLSPAQTRWLSLQACINRILEQNEALKQYFILIVNEDPTYCIERIHKSLQNKFTLAYLEFLSYQLERFNDFNLLFQCEKPVLHCLKPQVEMLLRSIAGDFMKRDYVKATNPKKISPRCEEFHVPLKNVYLGMAATATLREIAAGAKEDVSAFRSYCRNFLVESIYQIQKRFDLDAEIHDIVQCTLPQNAASTIPPSLEGICQKLPYLKEILNTEKLDREWREHAMHDKVNGDLSWEEYWTTIRDVKSPTGQPKFPNLTKFVQILATFPSSNAAVERIFSSLKLVKTDRRASLKSSSLVSLLQFNMAMKKEKFSAATLKPSENMLKLANNMKASATDEEVKGLRKKFIKKSFK